MDLTHRLVALLTFFANTLATGNFTVGPAVVVLTLPPIICVNWNASSGNVWLVPLGGGIGRIMRLGFQPVNITVQAYGNVKRPDHFPSTTWQLKFQLAFLYPKRPKER